MRNTIEMMHILNSYGITRRDFMLMAYWEILERINIIKKAQEKDIDEN